MCWFSVLFLCTTHTGTIIRTLVLNCLAVVCTPLHPSPPTSLHHLNTLHEVQRKFRRKSKYLGFTHKVARLSVQFSATEVCIAEIILFLSFSIVIPTFSAIVLKEVA